MPSQFDRLRRYLAFRNHAGHLRGSYHRAEKAHEGGPYRLRVRAAQSANLACSHGVTIAEEIQFDGNDDDIVLKQSARTGPDGLCYAEFQIPRGLEDDEGDLEVVARRGSSPPADTT